jgi:hypothetical protein
VQQALLKQSPGADHVHAQQLIQKRFKMMLKASLLPRFKRQQLKAIEVGVAN